MSRFYFVYNKEVAGEANNREETMRLARQAALSGNPGIQAAVYMSLSSVEDECLIAYRKKKNGKLES